MDMPKPTEAHEKLRRLVGTWEGEEIMHPSMWDPGGSTAQARSTNRLALGGFVVIGDYEQWYGKHVTFAGHSVYTYDSTERCYALYWWDSMGMPPNVFKGNFDDGVLTVTSEQAVPGGPRFSRLTYDLSESGKLTSRIEMSDDGESWTNFMDGTYTRQD